MGTITHGVKGSKSVEMSIDRRWVIKCHSSRISKHIIYFYCASINNVNDKVKFEDSKGTLRNRKRNDSNDDKKKDKQKNGRK